MSALHMSWEHEVLKDGNRVRDTKWTKIIAVMSEEFVGKTKDELEIRAKAGKVWDVEGQFELREPEASYRCHFKFKKGDVRHENTYIWKDYPQIL